MRLDRQRHKLVIFIGLIICISLWRITVIQTENIPSASFLFYGERKGTEDWKQLTFRPPPSPPPPPQPPLPEAKATIPTTSYSSLGAAAAAAGTAGVESSASGVESVTSSVRIESIDPSSEIILPNSDLFKLIDLSNFSFTINQPNCDKLSSLFVVLVHSAPRNYFKRNRIRDTWGSLGRSRSTDANYKLYFLLGLSHSLYEERQLALENQMFSDIIQGNFIDDYKNMTYKHVMGLKWFNYFCSNTSYLVKTDDDVFVNIKQLMTFLLSTSSTNQSKETSSTFEPSVPTTSSSSKSFYKNFIFCHKLREGAVKRSHRSKWYVSPKDYKQKYYPEYCPGYIVVYSGDVVSSLYMESQNHSYFWIDDVHLTGNIRKKLNIPITSFEPYLLKESVLLKAQNDDNKIKELCKYLFAWSNIKPTQIDYLWKTINTYC